MICDYCGHYNWKDGFCTWHYIEVDSYTPSCSYFVDIEYDEDYDEEEE